jgi:hypothetical protein
MGLREVFSSKTALEKNRGIDAVVVRGLGLREAELVRLWTRRKREDILKLENLDTGPASSGTATSHKAEGTNVISARPTTSCEWKHGSGEGPKVTTTAMFETANYATDGEFSLLVQSQLSNTLWCWRFVKSSHSKEEGKHKE